MPVSNNAHFGAISRTVPKFRIDFPSPPANQSSALRASSPVQAQRASNLSAAQCPPQVPNCKPRFIAKA